MISEDANDDSLIVLAPSMLCEGKAIGTAKLQDLALLKHLMSAKDLDGAALSDARKRGRSAGRRKLVEVQDRVRVALNRMIEQHYGGRLGENKLRENAVRVMKTAWRDVFLAGLRAGGADSAGGHGKPMVQLESGDQKWVKGAMTHEMRFLNGFLDAIVSEEYKMPLPRRVEMYVNSLTSFYENAKLIALPWNCVIHWAGPMDKQKCPSCQYMVEHGPFTKLTLPTVPRSGATLCLTNCRDRLVIRRVEANEAVKVSETSKTRERHIAALQRIKRLGR